MADASLIDIRRSSGDPDSHSIPASGSFKTLPTSMVRQVCLGHVEDQEMWDDSPLMDVDLDLSSAVSFDGAAEKQLVVCMPVTLVFDRPVPEATSWCVTGQYASLHDASISTGISDALIAEVEYGPSVVCGILLTAPPHE